jgi:hypothetical protein
MEQINFSCLVLLCVYYTVTDLQQCFFSISNNEGIKKIGKRLWIKRTGTTSND